MSESKPKFKKVSKKISAAEFEKKFDEGKEDITPYLDLQKARVDGPRRGHYKCRNCRYKGKKIILETGQRTYCIGKETGGAALTSAAPEWIKNKYENERAAATRVLCPKCRTHLF